MIPAKAKILVPRKKLLERMGSFLDKRAVHALPASLRAVLVLDDLHELHAPYALRLLGSLLKWNGNWPWTPEPFTQRKNVFFYARVFGVPEIDRYSLWALL